MLLTGITPQQTIAEGITEAEFLKIFYASVATKDTVFVGYNNVRFDDEFMRYLNYRNFYDAYEWHWSEGRSRWDVLDVIRMMRALRPEGIEWPIDKNKKPTNRLELLTKANNIKHDGAHDALSDVTALIELTRLIKTNQPKLFNYLFDVMQSKGKIDELVNSGQPFVYTSGKYPSEFEKTTVVAPVVGHPKRQGVLIFDLRYDPEEYSDLSVAELVKLWYPVDKDAPRLPIKSFQFNRQPAVAPLSVLDEASQKRIGLKLDTVMSNYKKLTEVQEKFGKNLLLALAQLDRKQDTNSQLSREVDARLYEDFINPKDKQLMGRVVTSEPSHLSNLDIKFDDGRLNLLLPLYKARNFPQTLNTHEVEIWDKFKARRLLEGKENSRLGHYFKQLSELANDPKLTSKQTYIVEELKLYGESILPVDV